MQWDITIRNNPVEMPRIRAVKEYSPFTGEPYHIVEYIHIRGTAHLNGEMRFEEEKEIRYAILTTESGVEIKFLLEEFSVEVK